MSSTSSWNTSPGATLDELVASVGLSRTAINQHLMALEREGFVQKTVPRKSGGRPQNVYVLTEAGTNSFPKQYSWFSKLLIQTLRQQVRRGAGVAIHV